MRGPLYVVAQNVWLRTLKVMRVLKLCFSGSLDDLRARYGSRLRRLAPFHIWQVDCLALSESTPSLARKPDLISTARPKAGFAGAALANTGHTRCNGSSG